MIDKKKKKMKYVKPEIKKHKAASVAALSPGSCNYYTARYSGGTYYY